MHSDLPAQLASERALGPDAPVCVRGQQPLADRVHLVHPRPPVSSWMRTAPVQGRAPLGQRGVQEPTPTVGVDGEVKSPRHLPLGETRGQHHLVDRRAVGLGAQRTRRHPLTDCTRQVVGHPHLLADGLPQSAQRREPLEVRPRLHLLHRLEDLQLRLGPRLRLVVVHSSVPENR